MNLHNKSQWDKKKPLSDIRVLVTRARHQASELSKLIAEWGGEVVELPVIEIIPLKSAEKLSALDQAIHSLSTYDWIMFTSVNGVDYFFDRMQRIDVGIHTMSQARIAAVGPQTAEALTVRGLTAETPPRKYQWDGMVEALESKLEAGQKVLLPRSAIANKALPEKLRQLGLDVTEVDVYETVLSSDNADGILQLLLSNKIHIITFTSTSTVNNFIEILSKLGVEHPQELLQGVHIACIGPITARTAVKQGLLVTQIAKEATITSLLDALITPP